MTEDWEEFMDGVEEGDKEEVKRRMEPIYNEVDIWRKDPTQSIPYTSSRVKAAIKQFTELVSGHVIMILRYLHYTLHRLKHIAPLKALRSVGLLHTSGRMSVRRFCPHSGEVRT